MTDPSIRNPVHIHNYAEKPPLSDVKDECWHYMEWYEDLDEAIKINQWEDINVWLGVLMMGMNIMRVHTNANMHKNRFFKKG